MTNFAWSWSKLNNFETCPFRHLKIDIQKAFREEQNNPILVEGTEIHDAMAARLRNGTPLPAHMAPFEYWADRVSRGSGKLAVEQMYSVKRDFTPAARNSPDVWLRCKMDASRIDGPVGLVVDWKTGRRKPVEDLRPQLVISAQCLFSFHPSLETVVAKFIWLQEDAQDEEWFTRESLSKEWFAGNPSLMTRVERMELMIQHDQFPQTPCGLCVKYCPVQVCPFYRKGTR